MLVISTFGLDAVLKNLPELNADENRIGTHPSTPSPTSDESTSATSFTVVATNPAPKTPPPKRMTRKDLPPTTPHNAIGVKQHVEVVLEEFDSLGCQGVELESSIRERVQQLAKSAYMLITQEAIRTKTNWQLRQLNRKKGKPGGEGTGPDGAQFVSGRTIRFGI